MLFNGFFKRFFDREDILEQEDEIKKAKDNIKENVKDDFQKTIEHLTAVGEIDKEILKGMTYEEKLEYIEVKYDLFNDKYAEEMEKITRDIKEADNKIKELEQKAKDRGIDVDKMKNDKAEGQMSWDDITANANEMQNSSINTNETKSDGKMSWGEFNSKLNEEGKLYNKSMESSDTNSNEGKYPNLKDDQYNTEKIVEKLKCDNIKGYVEVINKRRTKVITLLNEEKIDYKECEEELDKINELTEKLYKYAKSNSNTKAERSFNVNTTNFNQKNNRQNKDKQHDVKKSEIKTNVKEEYELAQENKTTNEKVDKRLQIAKMLEENKQSSKYYKAESADEYAEKIAKEEKIMEALKNKFKIEDNKSKEDKDKDGKDKWENTK